MFYSFLRSEKGFTLVELMIVVVILGILVAVGVPVYISSETANRKKDCDSQCVVIESIVGQAMSGMMDSGKRQYTIPATSTYPGDGVEGNMDDKYVGMPCLVLNNSLTLGDIRGQHRSSCEICKDKNLSYSEGCWGLKRVANDVELACSEGHFLKKTDMAGTAFYNFFQNQEIPVCPFADSENTDGYYYFIVVDDKGTTMNSATYTNIEKRDRVWEQDDEIVILCNCPKCNDNPQ